MDIEMPTQDGFTTSMNILKITAKSHLEPIIIACSGYSKEIIKEKADIVGIKEILEKPIKK